MVPYHVCVATDEAFYWLTSRNALRGRNRGALRFRFPSMLLHHTALVHTIPKPPFPLHITVLKAKIFRDGRGYLGRYTRFMTIASPAHVLSQ